MRAVLTGSAAGGGVPQWNCRCPVCSLARAGNARVVPRAELGLAVSADGERWVLVGGSLDLGTQVRRFPFLHPQHGARSSPIAAVLLLGAEIDQMAGLLALREGHTFSLWAPADVLDAMAANPMFGALDPARVTRRRLAVGTPVQIAGLSVELFAVPGKTPLWAEEPGSGAAWGVEIAANGRRFVYVPCCADIRADLARRLEGAPLLLFDGTCWTDDELVALGLSTKTARAMGHLPMAGADGSLERLRALGIGRLIYAHLNNSNPVLIADGPERRAVTAAGAEIAHDGLELFP